MLASIYILNLLYGIGKQCYQLNLWYMWRCAREKLKLKFLLSEKLLLTTNPTEFPVAANVSDSLHTQKETV